MLMFLPIASLSWIGNSRAGPGSPFKTQSDPVTIEDSSSPFKSIYESFERTFYNHSDPDELAEFHRRNNPLPSFLVEEVLGEIFATGLLSIFDHCVVAPIPGSVSEGEIITKA